MQFVPHSKQYQALIENSEVTLYIGPFGRTVFVAEWKESVT